MRGLDAGDRLKYCRKILKISQKELADNKVSSNLISLIERRRVPLSTVTASLLIDNLNRLSKERHMNMSLSLKDLLIPYGEYVLKLCEGSVKGSDGARYVQNMYERFLGISHEIDDSCVNRNIEMFFGKIYFEKEIYEKAEEHLERALENSEDWEKEPNETSVDVYYYLSKTYYHNGRVEDGIKLGEKCYKLISDGNFGKSYIESLREMIWKSLSAYENQITENFMIELDNIKEIDSDKITSIKKMIDVLYDYAESGQCHKIKSILEKLKKKVV